MTEIPLKDLADRLEANLETLIKAVKIEIFSGVVSDTRVDTGRLRGNWQATTGQPAAFASLLRTDKTGSQVNAEIVATVKADTIDYLTNNLPYAEVWEERDGMVARNVARVNRNIRKQIRSL